MIKLLCVDAKGSQRWLQEGSTYTLHSIIPGCVSCGHGSGFISLEEVDCNIRVPKCLKCGALMSNDGRRGAFRPSRFIQLNDPEFKEISESREMEKVLVDNR